MGYAKDKIKLMNIAITKTLQTNPDMTNDQLKARFGCSKTLISNIRRKLGIVAPFSEYVTDYDLKRGKAVIDIADVSYREIYYGNFAKKRKTKYKRLNNN